MSAPVIRTFTLAGGATRIETISGRCLTVISCTAGFTIRFDGGEPVPLAVGRRFGERGSAVFNSLEIKDTSGSSNTITIYVGDEPLYVQESANVSLDSSTVLSITPAQQTLTCAGEDITASTDYADRKSITVQCISGTCTVAGLTLQSGDQVTWSVFRHQDKLATLTVAPGAGGTTRVITLA